MSKTNSDLLDRTAGLIQAGFKLVPLGSGADGKGPIIKSWTHSRLGQKSFTNRMVGANSTMYGIRLDGMVVLDCDVHDPALVDMLEGRFGPATVKVRTPRGVHLYYRYEGEGFPIRRMEGLPVDIKHGGRQYVVGAGSIRPCGGQYVPLCGELGVTPLTLLQDLGDAASAFPPLSPTHTQRGKRVQEGLRHTYLMRRAVVFAPTCQTEEELRANLTYVRDEECGEPSTLTDDEVAGIAEWAFDKRQSGQLYASSGGSFRVPRHFARSVRCNAGAAALLLVLYDEHGHHPNKVFDLNYAAMKEAMLTDLSERGFQRAGKALLSVGAIVIAQQYQAGKSRRKYRLGVPPVAL